MRYWVRVAFVLIAAVGCLSGCARGKYPRVEAEQRTGAHEPGAQAPGTHEPGAHEPGTYEPGRRFSLFKPAYKRAVEDAHRRYRESLEHIPAREVRLPPRHSDGRRYAEEEPAGRRSRSFRRRTVRTVERRERSATSFRMNPSTPYVGSPEHTREQEYQTRREREMDRRMRSICARC